MAYVSEKLKLEFENANRISLEIMEKITDAICEYRKHIPKFYNFEILYLVKTSNILIGDIYIITYKVMHIENLKLSMIKTLKCKDEFILRNIASYETIVTEEDFAKFETPQNKYLGYHIYEREQLNIVNYIRNLTITWALLKMIGNHRMYYKYLLVDLFKYLRFVFLTDL